jgi:GH15 family glucan-1,4-alpha-glucosidase
VTNRIEDYGLIGDCESAALVSLNGSIDWLCVPRFDSPSCFSALLGTPKHGRWLIRPKSEIRRVQRTYRDTTLILETTFETEQGKIKLIDFMPLRSFHADVIRIVEGVQGEVEMEFELILRFDYASYDPWLRQDDEGIDGIAGPDQVRLNTKEKLQIENGNVRGKFTVRQGQTIPFTLMYHRSYLDPPKGIDVENCLHETENFWREWTSHCKYQGSYKDAVVRSLIVLKALTYTPTGGIVAAPTTSLPEKIGGERNWDYRYCWIRDATFTLYSLLLSGFVEEAKNWRKWLLRAVAGNPSQMQILYGLAGERRIAEWNIEWLPGFENSAPVRIGNAAYSQFQLDVYGEIMDSIHLARSSGLEAVDEGWRVQTALIERLEIVWKEPDEGIWEVRGPRRHFTHSKVMAWVAVDRMIKGIEQFGLKGPINEWRKLREEIHNEICNKGFNAEVNSFVQYYESTQLDASLLMMALVGFLPPEDPRIQGTINAIRKNLTVDDFVLRYRTHEDLDGLPKGEGVFLPCSFWMVDNLILQGRTDEAREMFERLLALRNDLGLLSEEYDPHDKRLLGNFPQAFSHVGIINTAWNFDRHQGPAEDRKNSGARQDTKGRGD